jgi:phosphate transport system substrate-binding protein
MVLFPKFHHLGSLLRPPSVHCLFKEKLCPAPLLPSSENIFFIYPIKIASIQPSAINKTLKRPGWHRQATNGSLGVDCSAGHPQARRLAWRCHPGLLHKAEYLQNKKGVNMKRRLEMKKVRRHVIRDVGLVILLVTFVACEKEKPNEASLSTALAPFSNLEGTLDIAGGTAHLSVMEEAAKRIMTANPKIRITVAGGGSGVGVQKVGEGLVHIGNTGRPLSDEEKSKYGLKSFAFAIDGVAVAVHPDNPVKALTSQQVKDIFAGTISNWKDVGEREGAINLYGRDEASGTRSVFWKKLLEKGPVALAANIVPSNGAMKTALSGDKNAIGYLSIGHVNESVAAVTLDGIQASQENARTDTYKVTRKLYMNTKGEPSGLTKAFIDYILSAEGAKIILAKGYIPITK